MTNNQSVFDEIRASYQIKKRLVPFVGAGFSRNIDSYPTWDRFVTILKDNLNLDKTKKKAFDKLPNNLEKTEYFIREKGKTGVNIPILGSHKDYEDVLERGRNILVEQMKTLFNPSDHPFNRKKWSTHRLLIEKFPKLIYTTNWDDTLERCIPPKNTDLSPKANYAFSKNGDKDGRPRIIKYHGDYTHDGKEFLVACLTDYQRRMTAPNQLDLKFQSDLLRYDFLLIGYSFTDPNIHLMLHNLSEMINNINQKTKANHIDTKIFMVVLEKSDDLRVNLLRDTFHRLKTYHLLDANDYDSKGNPKSSIVKIKMNNFLKSL